MTPMHLLLARMEIARRRGMTIRLTLPDLQLLSTSPLGLAMEKCADEALQITPTTSPNPGAGR